jgi:hypothetical protein
MPHIPAVSLSHAFTPSRSHAFTPSRPHAFTALVLAVFSLFAPFSLFLSIKNKTPFKDRAFVLLM